MSAGAAAGTDVSERPVPMSVVTALMGRIDGLEDNVRKLEGQVRVLEERKRRPLRPGSNVPAVARDRDEWASVVESSPAVRQVIGKRIFYADEFRDECLRRLEAGELPSRIFRDAGIGPELIGRKRIERCVARWRSGPIPSDM